MSVVTSRSEAAPPAVHGVAELAFGRRDGCSTLVRLHQRAPMRVLFPRPTEPDLPLAALVLTSGGLVGGDRIDVCVRVGEGAAALVTGQAAEKVYRSAGEPCRLQVRLAAAAAGWLEWLPQETILFDGARLERRTRLDVTAGARLMAGDIVVFGRAARGEVLTRGAVTDAVDVWCDGRLAFADTFQIEDDPAAVLASPAALAGAAAIATFLYVGNDPAFALAAARELQATGTAPEVRASATVAAGVMVARWLGTDARAVRVCYGAFRAGFRRRVADRPAALPRLWSI